MKRFKNILFYTDGRGDSDPALSRAVELAQRNHGQLTVLGVLRELPRELSRLVGGIHPVDLQESAMQELRERLAELVAPFREMEPPVDIAIEVRCGVPFIEIIRTVLRFGHDLVTMSAEGRRGMKGMLFGSTSLHLMRKCPCPIWVIKPSRHRRVARILAAIDPDATDSVRDEVNVRVMELATSLARLEGSELHVVHVWDVYDEFVLRRWRTFLPDAPMDNLTKLTEMAHRSQVEELLGRFDFDRLRMRSHLLRGEVGTAITQLAARQRIDLIVMGTAARSGLAGFFMGNTAETVLQQVNCSVLTIKPDGFVTPVRLHPTGSETTPRIDITVGKPGGQNPPQTKKEQRKMKNKQTVETNREPTTGVQTDTAPTRFEFESATVKSVCLAGTFNDWNPAATEMIPDGDGRWVKEMTVPPGAYEYLFVVDGEWVEDPRATESVSNPFNRNNSLRRVAEGLVNA